MKIVEHSIRQPITITVGIILTLLAGFVALSRVPVQLTPEVEDTVIAVTTTWENASPQEIESEVIDEQEERLQNVENLRSITSISQRGQGQIRLEFLTGANKEEALREVSDKLREVPSYPFNVDEPVIRDSDPDSRDYIAWVTLTCSDPNFDLSTLFDYVDKRLRPQFERLPGVGEVGIYGGREREVQIRVDPTRLAQRGITMSQFVAAIQSANENFSGGALPDGKSDVRIRTVGRFKSPRQVETIAIKNDEGGPVTIRDVAEVVETYKEQDSFVHSKGEPVIAINFQRELGANVIDVMKALKEEIARMNQPGGILDIIARTAGVNGTLRLTLTYDQTLYIDQALNLVQNNILLGGSIATLTLLLFLRSLRSIAVIAISIPISIIGSIVAMVALGRTINVISLAGMAFAVGMVVDNSIVVLENIYRHREMGKKIGRAAMEGASEVGGAVLASTLTTLIVFIPILMIQETAGQLFRDIALAICASVGISFLVSITVIPSAANLLLGFQFGTRHLYEYEETQAGKSRKRSLLARLASLRQYPHLVRRLVERLFESTVLRWLVVAGFLAVTLIGTYLLIPPIDYLPLGNRNIIIGIMNPPPGYNLDHLAGLADQIEKRVRPFWEAGMEHSDDPPGNAHSLPAVPLQTLNGPMTIVPPPLDNYFLVVFAGRMFHGSISKIPERVVDLVPLMQYATDSSVAPGVISYAFQLPLFRLGGVTGSAVKVDLVGTDLNSVSRSASALFGNMIQRFGIATVQPEPNNFNIPSPELQALPSTINLSDLGLTVRDLGIAVQVDSDGLFVGDYEIGGELVDLKVISKDAVGQPSIPQLSSVPLATPLGKIVNLGSVAQLVRTAEPDQIKRVGRQRAVTLQFTPPLGVPLQQAIRDVEESIAQLKNNQAITPDVDIQLSGSASKLDEMKIALLGDGTLLGLVTSSLFLALLVVYLLMCVLFQSWLYPFVIMLTVPLATFGGLLALSAVHTWSVHDRYLPIQNMDVLTILGFVILAGVVVNNAILIVHQTLNFMSGRSEIHGQTVLNPHHAIALSVESRVRPIMMSSLTSVGGMLPLVLMPGSGSELYRGLGSVVVGGLFCSTIFTLVLIPVVLSLVFDIKDYLHKLRGHPEIPLIPMGPDLT